MRIEVIVRRVNTIRLRGFDYRRAGSYFVTISSRGMRRCFGTVESGRSMPSWVGEIIREEWFRTADLRSCVRLEADELVIMPDHLHGIIHVVRRYDPRPGEREAVAVAGPRADSLGAIVGQIKSRVSRRVNARAGRDMNIWHRGYHEVVIRNARHLEAVRRYIRENPMRWQG